ncbi:protein SHORT HYPOCOTYL IN WHITE LIGHT 1 [Aristolochia californica]|uniref:protein SHORT HYPOCOTYL IN WHITE LIGHT 1 n=1 Tax=Aristolochia californica TaxID=171875 RepID=UPI0035D6AA3F
MAAVSLSSSRIYAYTSSSSSSSSPLHPSMLPIFVLKSSLTIKCNPHLRASRRISNYTQEATIVPRHRVWGGVNFDDDDDDSDDEHDDDRSLDLLVRFIQNVFRKVSRRARKAVRSVLPIAISPKLVRFSVNGVLILTFLWVLKAFLEVICTLGSIVFVSILLIRGVWTGINYFQENRYNNSNGGFDNESGAWTSAQPAT